MTESHSDIDPSIPGVNELLVGATGTGKTHALRSWVEAGFQVFAVFTEPGALGVVGDIPPDKLHWKYIPPSTATWEALIDSAKKINTLSYKALAELTGVNKQEYAQFIDVLTTLSNFVCERTGESFGDVDSWSNDRVLYLDSLSGLNIMAMNLVVGSKPTKSQADWGMAMDNLERLIQKLCLNTTCHFTLTSHLERETDEITGAQHLMPGTLGRKLAPRIPRYFDDVVHCIREGEQFRWSTASINVDLKKRMLPLSDKIDPSFGQVAEEWRRQARTETQHRRERTAAQTQAAAQVNEQSPAT